MTNIYISMNEYVLSDNKKGSCRNMMNRRFLGQAYPHCRSSSRPAPLGSDTADTQLCNILNSLERNWKCHSLFLSCQRIDNNIWGRNFFSNSFTRRLFSNITSSHWSTNILTHFVLKISTENVHFDMPNCSAFINIELHY